LFIMPNTTTVPAAVPRIPSFAKYHVAAWDSGLLYAVNTDHVWAVSRQL